MRVADKMNWLDWNLLTSSFPKELKVIYSFSKLLLCGLSSDLNTPINPTSSHRKCDFFRLSHVLLFVRIFNHARSLNDLFSLDKTYCIHSGKKKKVEPYKERLVS